MRCVKVVDEELTKLGLEIESIELGRVILVDTPSAAQLKDIKTCLEDNGFELIDEKKNQLIDQIKTLIIELVHYDKYKAESVNNSDFLAQETGYDYSYLSSLFSSTEGVSIERYIIHQKIEKVKELLIYDELSLKEIAFQLNYSSAQHLSNQFKKVVGSSPSQFKASKENKRQALDNV